MTTPPPHNPTTPERRWGLLRWALHGSAAVLFAWGALVQLNDPDPLRWVIAYGLTALVALTAPLKPPGLTEMAAALSLGYLAWAAWIARHGIPFVTIEEMFGDLTMKTDAVELWRETLGLAILGSYLLAVALWSRRQATSPHGP
ncbi:MAG: transmembrane 220 family protein [Myxococcota bacterium]